MTIHLLTISNKNVIISNNNCLLMWTIDHTSSNNTPEEEKKEKKLFKPTFDVLKVFKTFSFPFLFNRLIIESNIVGVCEWHLPGVFFFFCHNNLWSSLKSYSFKKFLVFLKCLCFTRVMFKGWVGWSLLEDCQPADYTMAEQWSGASHGLVG